MLKINHVKFWSISLESGSFFGLEVYKNYHWCCVENCHLVIWKTLSEYPERLIYQVRFRDTQSGKGKVCTCQLLEGMWKSESTFIWRCIPKGVSLLYMPKPLYQIKASRVAITLYQELLNKMNFRILHECVRIIFWVPFESFKSKGFCSFVLKFMAS